MFCGSPELKIIMNFEMKIFGFDSFGNLYMFAGVFGTDEWNQSRWNVCMCLCLLFSLFKIITQIV